MYKCFRPGDLVLARVVSFHSASQELIYFLGSSKTALISFGSS